MSKRYRVVLPLVVVLAMTAVVAAQPSVTVAQEEEVAASSAPFEQPAISSPAAPVPGGPGFYSQTSIGFQPWPNNTVPYAFSGRTLYNPDTVSHAYEAMINVPHGAVITKFVVWAYDNNSSTGLWAAIGKAALDDSSVAQIARIDTTGATGSVRVFEDTTISAPKVDLQSYTYWIEVYLPPGASVGLVSFRIDYSFPTYLPVVIRN